MLPESDIGHNIRKIRKLEKLTLDELAKKCGISKGYLSKVENSDKAPPVSTLINIARGLGITISDIFGESKESKSFSLVKKNERQFMSRNGTIFGYSYETLAHNYPNKKMEPYILTIPAHNSNMGLFQHNGEEMLMVLKGKFTFRHGEKEYPLEEGDCVYFDSGIPHRAVVPVKKEVKCLIVIFTP